MIDKENSYGVFTLSKSEKDKTMDHIVKKTVIAKMSVLILLSTACFTFGQSPVKWKIHDLNRPQPKVITQTAPLTPHPPSDAVILYDGSDLSKWQSTDGSAPKWVNKEGYFECVRGSGYIQTKQGFGDVQLHIEWATPQRTRGNGQGRGNSGIFLMGKYEVQVLDSFENTTYPDGQAGAVYGQSPPLVNATLPPGEWQSYDIVFRRPRFDSIGKLIKPALITVMHNGVLVQDHVEIWGGTEWLHYIPYKAHADKLPLSLQDHGNPVRYRNIWLRELERKEEEKPTYLPTTQLKPEEFQLYTGTFIAENGNQFEIRAIDNGLILISTLNGVRHGDFELEKYSKEKLSSKSTAIDLNFSFNNDGIADEMIYQFEGNKTRTKRSH